jgi:hypothetical protein
MRRIIVATVIIVIASTSVEEEEYRGEKPEESESQAAPLENPPELPRNGAEEWVRFPQ